MAAGVADEWAGGEHTAEVACEDGVGRGNISSFKSRLIRWDVIAAGLGNATDRIGLNICGTNQYRAI
jgi:hypothetical protein